MRYLKGKIIYTGEGILRDKYIHYDGNKIINISNIKGEGEYLGEYEVITPAFIDAHSHIGLSRNGEPFDEEDVNEHMDSIVPILDVYDAVQMDDSAFRDSIEDGVLYSCILPGSGNIIGGRSILIRNYSSNIMDAYITHTGIKSAFGYNPKSTTDWKGNRPNTRMGAVALLREKFDHAKKVMQLIEKGKKDPMEIDMDEEIFIKLLKREERLRIHVHKTDDVMSLIRLKREYNIDVTIEHTADVNLPSTYEILKMEDIPVIYGPIDSFSYKVELKHESWKNVRHLIQSGVKYGLMTDHPVMLQRNLFYQLRYFLRYGLSRSEAIGVITKNNAEILRVDDRYGTIANNKLASLVGWTGDPFNLENHPNLVIGEGDILYEE